MKWTKGFSLVELVVVIVVIGLLAALALPRFLDINQEAKKASIKAVAGNYATAILSTRSQWEAYGRPRVDGSNVVNYDGTDFWLTDPKKKGQEDYRPGYPIIPREDLDGNDTGSYPNALTSAACVLLMEMLLQNAPSVAKGSSDITAKYRAESVSENNNNYCKYTQQENEEHFFIYQPESGQVVVTLQ